MSARIDFQHLALIALVVLLAFLGFAGSARADIRQSLDIAIPSPPAIVGAEGKRKLVYELHLTNFAADPITIQHILVRNGEGPVLATFNGESLRAALGLVGGKRDVDTRIVPAGGRAILYVDVPVGGVRSLNLLHKITFNVNGQPGEISMSSVPVAVAMMLRLGPPLRGGPWVAVYDPAMERGHRRVIYATEGKAVIPGRFAVDWIKLDAAGRMATGDKKRADQFYAYGQEVLAVADGVIVAVRNDVPQPVMIADIPRVSIGDATGNYVVLDIGGGRYAFYEHLLPGVPVELGNRVKRGQVIGRVGITGQGSEPHLHFHVADTRSPLGGDGKAWLMDNVDIVGGYSSIADAVSGKEWTKLDPRAGKGAGRGQYPAPNQVVRFPQ